MRPSALYRPLLNPTFSIAAATAVLLAGGMKKKSRCRKVAPAEEITPARDVLVIRDSYTKPLRAYLEVQRRIRKIV